jgi:hypothetical protein
VPSHSLTDQAGLRISAEDFLAAVSTTAAQPVWVDWAGLAEATAHTQALEAFLEEGGAAAAVTTGAA